MKEVERKFLAKGHLLPLMNQAYAIGKAEGRSDAVQEIEQGYLLVSKRAEVRIRKCFACDSNDYRMALKLGNGFVRREYEFDISRRAYKFLIRFARKFRKLRLDFCGWNIDFFHDELSGLVLAEHEDYKTHDPKLYELPPVPRGLRLVRDVTSEGTYANKNIAALSVADRRELAAEAKENG